MTPRKAVAQYLKEKGFKRGEEYTESEMWGDSNYNKIVIFNDCICLDPTEVLLWQLGEIAHPSSVVHFSDPNLFDIIDNLSRVIADTR